jgi:hypothetical protein
VFTRKSISLIAVLGLLTAIGVLAPGAAATKVTPANHVVALAQTGQAPGFVSKNAWTKQSVQCTTVTAESKVPSEEANEENNTNRTGVGEFSTGPGSVLMPLSTPQFKNCNIYVPNGAGGWTNTGVVANVNTNAINGAWSLTAYARETPTFAIATVNIPKGGAEIEIPAAACILTVFPTESGSVNADWINGTNSENNPSTTRIDGQVSFARSAASCPEGSPAQYEATFSVKDVTEAMKPILNQP